MSLPSLVGAIELAVGIIEADFFVAAASTLGVLSGKDLCDWSVTPGNCSSERLSVVSKCDFVTTSIKIAISKVVHKKTSRIFFFVIMQKL